MKLFIKNMVCNRCKMVVRSELEKLGLHPLTVELGEAEIVEKTVPANKQFLLNTRFNELGFELISDRKSRIIEKVRNTIVQLVHHSDEWPKVNLSEYIVREVGMDYSYISNLFSQETGTTIEQYAINQRIERAKELLLYDELSLSEIAFRLHYSSASHFSRQFRKVTGITPSQFRQSNQQQRIPIEHL